MNSELTLDPKQPLEAVAALLAATAWPEALPDGALLTTAQAAMVAHVLRAAAAADPDWVWRPLWIKPGYLLMDPGEVSRQLAATMKRLGQSLMAARAARPFVAKALHGSPPPLPPGVARLSLNAIIPFVLGEEDETDPHSYEQRVFRRMLPVLHLALALDQAIGVAEESSGRAPSLEGLMLTEGSLRWLVKRAAALEEAVLAITEFKVPEEALLRVRLAG